MAVIIMADVDRASLRGADAICRVKCDDDLLLVADADVRRRGRRVVRLR